MGCVHIWTHMVRKVLMINSISFYENLILMNFNLVLPNVLLLSHFFQNYRKFQDSVLDKNIPSKVEEPDSQILDLYIYLKDILFIVIKL